MRGGAPPFHSRALKAETDGLFEASLVDIVSYVETLRGTTRWLLALRAF